MTRYLPLIVGLLANSICALAQQSKYDIGFSAGLYQVPSLTHAVSKKFIAADFDYHVSKYWTISTGFLSGQFAYFDDYRSNNFSYDDYTNANGYEAHTYLTVAYSIVATNRFTLQLGSGIGLFTQRLKFPYAAPSSWYGPRGLPYFTAEESFSAVEVPLKLEAYYVINKWIGLGIRAGTFIQKPTLLIGSYLGPQIRIRI